MNRSACPSTPAPETPIPSAGTIQVRVRYCECDPMGVAHHSACIPWFEIGRTELLRESGLTYAHMERAGIFLVVTKLSVNYKSPARYDDALTLSTTVTGGGRARIDHAYELTRTNDTTLLATGTSTLACVDATGRPKPLPDWLRADAHR